MWKRGELKATQLPTGTVIVDVQKTTEGVVIYARVSSSENKANLDSQAQRLVHYCEAKGYQIKKVIKEIGSGVNDNRQKLVALLNEDDYKIIVVERPINQNWF